MHGVWWAPTKLGVILAIGLLVAAPQSGRGQDHSTTDRATTDRARPASHPASDNCTRATFRVVVDVGHTADVPGAMSARGMRSLTRIKRSISGLRLLRPRSQRGVFVVAAFC